MSDRNEVTGKIHEEIGQMLWDISMKIQEANIDNIHLSDDERYYIISKDGEDSFRTSIDGYRFWFIKKTEINPIKYNESL